MVLVKGGDCIPTTDGPLLYLNACDSVQAMFEKVEHKGGQVLLPKTKINEVMGYFALFLDPEGNKLGLHATN